MAKRLPKKSAFPPCYRVIDPRTGISVYLTEDLEDAKKEARKRGFFVEAFEWGWYEDEWHKDGMWFIIHRDWKELPQA